MSDTEQQNTSKLSGEISHAAFKKNHAATSDAPKQSRRWWIWIAAGALLSLCLALAGFLAWYASAFERGADASIMDVYEAVAQGLERTPIQEGDPLVLLLLGLDQIAGQREASLLTDTMMLVAIHANGEVRLLPIPRDLWVASLQTKVNALYYYGEQEAAGDGQLLVTEVLEEISDIQIDETLVLSTQQVVDVVDALGGIDVDVERGFVDEEYPRSDVDPATTPLEEQYMTIEFDFGLQRFNGERALMFIRSRHSADLEEGTDVARSARQQLVFAGIIDRLTDPSLLMQPEVLGSLYSYFVNEMNTTLTPSTLVGLGRQIGRNGISLERYQIPVTTDEKMGILYHPDEFVNDQWVYLPYDRSFDELSLYMQDVLLSTQ